MALGQWVSRLAYCENDRYAQGVILSRIGCGDLPWAPIWDNVTTLSGNEWNGIVDIIYGGFPCQDISCAGLGKGLAGERSGLFREIVRLTGEIQPSFVFVENVPAIRTRGSSEVVRSFTEFGYDCRWTVVSAAEVGATHLRKRWFLLAHADGKGLPVSGGDEIPVNVEDRNEPKLLVQANLWGESSCDRARVDDGISPRVHRIRALGNAVVPLQAREAFKRLMGLR